MLQCTILLVFRDYLTHFTTSILSSYHRTVNTGRTQRALPHSIPSDRCMTMLLPVVAKVYYASKSHLHYASMSHLALQIFCAYLKP